MAELINGRTPEQIRFNVMECAHGHCLSECPYDSSDECTEDLLDDAFALIRHLEAERDALLKEVHGDCDKCKHYDRAAYVEPCKSCRKASGREGFEWRGVKPPEVSDGAV